MADEIRWTIALTPRAALLALLAMLMISAPLNLGSETMTMTTTYPSPVGIYKTIITTSNADLARDVSGAVVTVGKNGGAMLNINNPNNTPGKLNVNGDISATGTGNISASGAITAASFVLTPVSQAPSSPVAGQMWLCAAGSSC